MKAGTNLRNLVRIHFACQLLALFATFCSSRAMPFPSIPKSYTMVMKEHRENDNFPHLLILYEDARGNRIRSRQDHYFFHGDEHAHKVYQTSIRIQQPSSEAGEQFVITHYQKDHPAMCIKAPLNFEGLSLSRFSSSSKYMGEVNLTLHSPIVRDDGHHVVWNETHSTCHQWRHFLPMDRFGEIQDGEYADICVRHASRSSSPDHEVNKLGGAMTPIMIRYPHKIYEVIEYRPDYLAPPGKEDALFDPHHASKVPCEDG